jgi:nitrite reductase/ring-hydroxylating ferredoxin subunit
MIEVGQLTREIGLRAQLVVEDELDWEHLPHTHASTFSAISLICADRNGWEANVVLRDGPGIRMTVRLDPDHLGYVNATFDDDGTENGRTVVRFEPLDRDRCRMQMHFFVPERADLDKAATHAFYVAVWNRIIDEDIPKMIHHDHALREGPKLRKERRKATLADGTICEVPVYCPHQTLPLQCEPDADGIMTCPWHGYRFDARTGRCVSGKIKGWARA